VVRAEDLSKTKVQRSFSFPLSGRAPFTLSWERFESDFFAKMALTGVVKSMKDFYWDIRPKPEYGTIELRVCDTPLTVEDAAALACYFQAICRMLLHREDPEPAEDDYLVYNYNRFQACRFGIDASIVDPKNKGADRNICAPYSRRKGVYKQWSTKLSSSFVRQIDERCVR